MRLEPPETRRLEGRCPACGKPLTVGVMHRVEELADRAEDAAPARTAPFRCLVQLPEILSELLDVGPRSKAVEAAASHLVGRLGPEIDILERLPLEDVERAGGGLLREALIPAAGRQGVPGCGLRRRVRGDPPVRAGRDPRAGGGGAAVRAGGLRRGVAPRRRSAVSALTSPALLSRPLPPSLTGRGGRNLVFFLPLRGGGQEGAHQTKDTFRTPDTPS